MKVRMPLAHGGIMANYRCTAACRHCLYASAPNRSAGYIDEPTAKTVCGLLRAGGCRSVHIGGGEPFLDFEGLLVLAQTVQDAGLSLDYIETNAFWAADEERAKSWLRRLAAAGGHTLCISTDPFHAEYVPPDLPLRLAGLCDEVGMGYFLWQREYVRTLSRLQGGRAYSRKALEETLGGRYVLQTAQGYGVTYGGRALNIEEEYCKRRPLTALLDSSPCTSLTSSGHFHVDLYGRFIPPSCTGVAIPLQEVMEGIPEGRYPAVEALAGGGVAALWQYAGKKGFVPDEAGYTSGCGACIAMRAWLAEHAAEPGLDAEHYAASREYY